MKIISGEGNDRLNYGWLAVLRWTCSVCCPQEEGLWARSDREHRAHAGAFHGSDAPQGWVCWGREGDPPIPTGPSLSERDRKLSSSPTEAFGDAGHVVLLVAVVGKWMSREGCCLHWYLLPVLWSSAVMLLFIRLIPVIWFFLYLCVFIFIYNFQFLPFPTYYHNFETSLLLLFYVDLCPSVLNSVGLHLGTDLTTMFHHSPCFFRSLIFLIHLY